MKRKTQRLTFVGLGLCILGVAAVLILTALEDNVTYFMSPSELAAPDDRLRAGQRVRLGGLVEDGSVAPGNGAEVTFRVTDLQSAIPVSYTGILPDLFREGQGVVAEGRLVGGVFVADEVLAKHDETYMPPEVAEALKKSGQWQHLRERLQDSAQVPSADRP